MREIKKTRKSKITTRISIKSKKHKTRKSRKTITRKTRKPKRGGTEGFLFGNDSLREAVTDYMIEREETLEKYGEMRYWNTSKVTDMTELFVDYQFNNIDDIIEGWDVSNVTEMANMFSECNEFNQPLNRWNVSKVEDMSSMFSGCYSFNQPLDRWNVSKVEDMSSMFNGCITFNQSLDNWNVSNVVNMHSMFYDCLMFNEPLNNWNNKLLKVTDMSFMLNGCENFDQPLNLWNVSNVKNMAAMFFNCLEFNQSLNDWNVSNVRVFTHTFCFCEKFNQPLNNWNVSKARAMNKMFFGCIEFNQPLDSWNVPNTVNMSAMFDDCDNFQLIPAWYSAVNRPPIITPIEERERPYEDPEPEPEPEIPLVEFSDVEPEQLEERNIIYIGNKTIFDVIMYDEVPIKNYMKENNDAIIFYYINKFYAVKKGDLINAVIDPNVVKYVCPKVGTMRRIVRNVPYLYGRALGIECGLIKLSQIKQIIQSEDIKYVEIVRMNEHANSTASLSSLLPGADYSSSSHCQEGQGAFINQLYTFEPTNIPPVEPPIELNDDEPNLFKKMKLKR